MATTVVLIDDHPIVRAGMCSVLASAGDIQVLAEGASGADAFRLAALHKPDVLVLDVNLPDLSGVEVTRQLQASQTPTAILVLTVHNDPETIFGLLQNGATGYVLKDDALETLVQAVRAAGRGETWLSPAVAGQVVRRAVAAPPKAAPRPAVPPALASLTPREAEILRLLAQGLDNTAIADRLVLTRRTVQNHISNLYGKLNVTSRTEAALLAIQCGWAAAPGQAGRTHES